MAMIRIKRVYEKPTPNDGYLILTDRLWPRGFSKSDTYWQEWLKDIAPSTALRKWFNHQQELFPEFARRYEIELKEQEETLKRIKEISKKQVVTLLYGAKDEKHNQAIVLLEVLKKLK